ncbi:MAG: preprotein translocase subunit SecG [Spirochaetales bacterium]|nr:preprotein translocase subunit SecG [Spirochaetales bacterium]
MQILQVSLLVLFFVCCAVLIFLVLIQAGKGGGLGILGGSSSGSAFGASTMDIVTRATWWGAGLFFALSILAAIAFADFGPRIPIDEMEEMGLEEPLPGATDKPAETPAKPATP